MSIFFGVFHSVSLFNCLNNIMEIPKLEQEINDLRNQLREKENQLSELKTAKVNKTQII